MNINATHAEGNFLVIGGEKHGPFSGHWAACAAMIRLSNPGFKSLGGDKESDLAIERGIKAVRP